MAVSQTKSMNRWDAYQRRFELDNPFVVCYTTYTFMRGRRAVNLEPAGILGWIIVGLAAGWLASKLTGGGGYGLVGDLLLGLVGAFIGGVLFSALGGGASAGLLGSIAIATVGAMILIVLGRLFTRRSFT